MAIRYKIKVIDALKDAGYSTYRIRKENRLHEMTLQALRNNKLVSWDVLDKICSLLDCQPGDIIERVPEPDAPAAAQPSAPAADPVATEPPKRKRGRPQKNPPTQQQDNTYHTHGGIEVPTPQLDGVDPIAHVYIG